MCEMDVERLRDHVRHQNDRTIGMCARFGRMLTAFAPVE
jgi:hypothetical protein